MNNINSALNYPAINYLDVKGFFDMAIAELNTTLHTSIPSVSKMIDEFRQKVSKVEDNKVILTSDPELTNMVIPTDPTLDGTVKFYYGSGNRKFYILNPLTGDYRECNTLKAVYSTGDDLYMYQSMNYDNEAIWVRVPSDATYEADLDDYLPDDWVMLWLIPYVCYKYTVRDGGTASTFAEELTQGFQQLQETYNVPDKICLAIYADKPAYTSVVEAHLPNINIKVPTRAIYEEMKHARNINAVYDDFYDRGGF